MAVNARPAVISGIVVAYILLQFIWWEILLVRQNNIIYSERQKLEELAIPDHDRLEATVEGLHRRRDMQTYMIVGEGTVFLLLLLYGVFRIRKAQERERQLNTQQKNFLLSITHELKTPIAATKLQLQTLKRQPLEKAQADRLVDSALLETERLNGLIDDVLLASRLESGEFTFERSEADLGAFVEETVRRYFQPALVSGALKVTAEKGIEVRLDKVAFTSVITNLVDNAIKYTPAEKHIMVTVSRSGNLAVMRVADNGPGVAQSEKAKIFSRFYRSGDESVRKATGTGLGLYIVNYIAREHHAVVHVLDNHPAGAIFEVRFNEA